VSMTVITRRARRLRERCRPLSVCVAGWLRVSPRPCARVFRERPAHGRASPRSEGAAWHSPDDTATLRSSPRPMVGRTLRVGAGYADRRRCRPLGAGLSLRRLALTLLSHRLLARSLRGGLRVPLLTHGRLRRLRRLGPELGLRRA
jgi:hypothetical protein